MSYDFNLENIISASCNLADGEQINFDKLIFEESVNVSDFAQKHYIQTGVNHNTKIVSWEQPKNFGFLKKYSGVGCDWNTCTLSSEPTMKEWSPYEYNCSMDFCWNDEAMMSNFRRFWNMACTSDPEVQFNNVFYSFVTQQMVNAYNHSLWRIAYMDYKGNPNTDFAGIDNFFLKMQGVLVNPLYENEQFVHITENDGTNIATQMTLPADASYNYLKAMYDKMLRYRPYMMTKGGLKFRITRDLAMNYLTYLQDNKEVKCCLSMYDGITTSNYGLDKLNYLGIPIEIVDEWTQLTEWHANELSLTAFDKPHRIILTYDTELAVGTCDMDSFKRVKRHYDHKSEKLTIGIKTTLDVNLTFDKNFILAL